MYGIIAPIMGELHFMVSLTIREVFMKYRKFGDLGFDVSIWSWMYEIASEGTADGTTDRTKTTRKKP